MVDAVVVGSGPNGLAAAVTLARAGLSVEVLERNDGIGGGARTAELTLPGFRHDLGSAVHPLALQSPFFRAFRLSDRIDLVLPEVQYAHPLDGGRAGIAFRSIERTASHLGRDGRAYRRLFAPLAANADALAAVATDSLVRFPAHPFVAARLGLSTIEQGTRLWDSRFGGEVAPAMVTGVQAHTIQRLPSFSTAAAGLTLGAYAHARGWPVPVGGSQAIVDALAADLLAHGGVIRTGVEVRSMADVPFARATLFDTSARGMLRIAGRRLPLRYRAALRTFRFGNGVAKVDFALSGPVPWAADRVARAGTVHVGGTRAEIAAAEEDVARGRHADRPYVLAAQPSAVDATRAPEGSHVLWTYAHVPAGSTLDATEVVTRQIERFAPGFRDLVLASHARSAAEMVLDNPNYVGGDISAGAASFVQLVRRPVLSPEPWRTPADGIYLCSESAAPGPGVHGMVGWRAARAALRHTFGLPDDPDLAP